MASLRDLYLAKVGQTSKLSMLFEVAYANECTIVDTKGKSYIDFNSGISVSSVGHSNPKVVEAIKQQAERHLHTMVYGEHVQESQVLFADLLLGQLDNSFDGLYYLLTGTEAIETAMKLARRKTNRFEIVAARNAYHGSTQGAESLRSDKQYSQWFAPLVPGVRHINFNHQDDIKSITKDTACVIIEPVQAEAGIQSPQPEYLHLVQARCQEVGALFILDEIQTGFGRTGELFAFQKFGLSPDLVCIGKAMGGGLPLSGILGTQTLLGVLASKPALGHITTFGGHPLSCAAASASLSYLLEHSIIDSVDQKGAHIKQTLERHPIVSEVRREGMMLGIELIHRKYMKYAVSKAIENGVLVDFFLFNDKSIRVAPPLIISQEDLKEGLHRLEAAFDYAHKRYAK